MILTIKSKFNGLKLSDWDKPAFIQNKSNYFKLKAGGLNIICQN
jgi:hypothetical protein